MNDLEHMFVVGLGRLSYADPPEWVSKPAKEALENASGELHPMSSARTLNALQSSLGNFWRMLSTDQRLTPYGVSPSLCLQSLMFLRAVQYHFKTLKRIKGVIQMMKRWRRVKWRRRMMT